MLGANNMNHMMVNSAHKPVHHVATADASASSAGCLGFPAGGSRDTKGKGKGKGKTNPNAPFPKFPKPAKKEKKQLLASQFIHVRAANNMCTSLLLSCIHENKLRDTMPECGYDAIQWMLPKIVKAVGEAKLLGVRLQSSKHQAELSILIKHAFSQAVHHACMTAMCIRASIS